MIQFKSRILSYIEHRIAAIYDTDSTVLEPLDMQYYCCLAAIHSTNEIVSMDFNFVPLNLRRDMAMLGVIHRFVLR